MLPCRDLSARARTGGGYRGGQASIRSGGDVPDWDNTESRERDEDAAWRDLVARFDAPLTEQQPAPCPAREDMPPEPDPRAARAERETRARRASGRAGRASGRARRARRRAGRDERGGRAARAAGGRR